MHLFEMVDSLIDKLSYHDNLDTAHETRILIEALEAFRHAENQSEPSGDYIGENR